VTRARPGELITLALAVLVLDQATKQLVVATMNEGQSIPVIEGVLHWTFVRNPGAAFSLFTDVPWLFTILATAISIAILASARRPRSAPAAASLGLILGGAVGNLVDRVIRDPALFRGHVVDFIDLRVWPTFNVADSAVVVGCAVLVVASIREERASRREAAA
jgi:signal peptidase II